MRGCWRIKSIVCYVLAAFLTVSAGSAESVDDRYEFRIDGGALGPVMEHIHQETGLLLLFSHDLVGFEGVNAVNGQYTVSEAMAILLQDTGLTSGLTESGMIVITRENINREGDMASGKLKKSLLASVAAFMFGGANAQDVEVINDETAEQEREEDQKDVIVVTGTNIRGVSPDSSPSFVFDREDIDKTGFGTVSEFIQSLPQNFGGGPNADVPSLPNDRTTSLNEAFGSSVNLRGLGSGATLVLLNGRRLAPAGRNGGFVDISMIPLSAVERVEVLTDGASAIYGADAIAGVVNFVLRDDYDGAETFVRFGSVTEGDLKEYRAGQTFGKSWDSGNALVSYEFYHRDNLGAEDRDFSSFGPLPNDLLPEQESHNVLLSASQQLSERVTLRGHGTFSQRDGNRALTTFVNTTFTDARTKHYGGVVSVDVELWGDWLLGVSGGYQKLTEFTEAASPIQFQTDTDSALWSIDGKVDGTLFQLPGGEVKLATGLSYRDESFLNRVNTNINTQDDRSTFAVFGEAFIPIVGADNRRPGVERLELTLAGRHDHYSDFGDTFNPKVGLLWSPVEGLNFRGTYGESFRPPTLGETGGTNSSVLAFNLPDPSSPPTSVVILDARSNPDLRPETSTTWTAGLDYQQEFGPGNLDMSITLFDIGYKDRIDQATNNAAAPLNDPVLFADIIIADPDPAVTAALIADALEFVNISFGTWTMPGDEDYIIDLRLLNLATVDTRGLDVNLAYHVDSDIGQLNFGLNGNYLFKQEKTITSTSPINDVVDTVFNPVDLRLRGSASWSRDGLTASAFVNYVDSYVDDRNILGLGDVPVDSWTTVDLNLSYDTGDRTGRKLIDNTKFSLSVQNLFNQDPPSIEFDGFSSSIGYDPTNGNALGRFIAFQITKAW